MKKAFSCTLMLLLIAALHCGAADARYIFYFIGDGMGPGAVQSANYYSMHRMPEGEPLLMTTFPNSAWCTTYSANRPVTDSAAAGTALATGWKTFNSMIGMLPDSTALESVATRLHRLGWGVGLVTSVAADDATPAAFYAHKPSRSMVYEIGMEFAGSGFEFLAGAGLRGLTDKKGNPTDLRSTYRLNDILITRDINRASRLESRRTVLLSPDSVRNWNVGFTIDSIPGALTLPDMTGVCISHMLKYSPDRFFMMVEGGNIDHAAHANDPGAVIKETINFDQALDKAYRFYLAHPDETLIVVTADHETGGMAMGNNYLHYDADLKKADLQRISRDIFSDLARAMVAGKERTPSWDEMKEFLKEKLGFWTSIPVTPEQTDMLRRSYIRTFVDKIDDSQETLYSKSPRFVVDVYTVLSDHMGIGWTTIHHSGNPVAVYAVGAGADRFNGTLDNTDIPRLIFEAAGQSW